MNREKLIRAIIAIIQGCVMAFIVLFIFLSQKAEINLMLNEKGYYEQSDSEDHYSALSYSDSDGTLRILYRSMPTIKDYAISIVCGLAIGISIYRRPKPDAAPVIQYDSRLATEHPRYPDFIEEDSDRRHFYGDELVAVFSTWLINQPHS